MLCCIVYIVFITRLLSYHSIDFHSISYTLHSSLTPVFGVVRVTTLTGKDLSLLPWRNGSWVAWIVAMEGVDSDSGGLLSSLVVDDIPPVYTWTPCDVRMNTRRPALVVRAAPEAVAVMCVCVESLYTI